MEAINGRSAGVAERSPDRARVLALAALVSVGCVAYTPRPLDPRDELALLRERAGAQVDLGAQASRAPAEWFPLEANVDFSDGLSLAEANSLALAYAPDVLRKRHEQRIAGAEILLAGLVSNPVLFLGPRLSARDADLVFPASHSFPVPLWGRRGAEKEIAGHRFESVSFEVLNAELQALTEVRERFIRIAFLERELEMLENLRADMERVVGWVERLAAAAEVDSVTLFLAQLELDEASAGAEETRAGIASEKRALYGAIGLLPTAPIDVALDTDPAALPDLPDPHDAALLRHPELASALADYRRSESALKLEIRKQYPEVRLGPEYENDRGDSTIGVGLGIVIPLFGANRGGIAAAEALRDASRDRYRSLLLRLTHASADARAAWETAVRLLRSHREGAFQDAADAARALSLRLRSGEANVLEVLAAERAVARSRTRDLELERRAAMARLRAAAAGGIVYEEAPAGPPSGETP